jgi:hypothetical protein
VVAVSEKVKAVAAPPTVPPLNESLRTASCPATCAEVSVPAVPLWITWTTVGMLTEPAATAAARGIAASLPAVRESTSPLGAHLPALLAASMRLRAVLVDAPGVRAADCRAGCGASAGDEQRRAGCERDEGSTTRGRRDQPEGKDVHATVQSLAARRDGGGGRHGSRRHRSVTTGEIFVPTEEAST